MSRDTSGVWSITDHVCRVCLGRILTRNAMYMCSGCEVTSSLRPTAICGCGMSGLKHVPTGIRGVYKCGINPARGGISPAAIVILFNGEPLVAAA